MSDFELPPNLRALQAELPGLRQTLGRSLNDREPVTLPCPDMLPEVRWHLTQMLAGMAALEVVINHGLASVTQADGQAGQATPAAARLEGWIQDWAGPMREAQRLFPDPEEREARDWLVAAYRHVLRDLDAGLSSLQVLLADPKAELARRGLPTEGHVALPLTLVITAAPEIALLDAWVTQRRKRLFPTERQTRRQGLGFWGWVGAIALGSWVGTSLADDD